MFGLGVADDGLDGRAPAEFAPDGVGDAAPLARDIDLERACRGGVMAAITAVGDDAGQGRADLRFDLGQDGLERMARRRELPGIAFTWAMNWLLFERCRVVASETLTPNS